MSAAQRILLIFLVLLNFWPYGAVGQWKTTLGSDAGVSITVDSLFDEGPRCGYLPVRVTIENASASEATYDLQGSATFGFGVKQERTATRQTLRVPARVATSAELLIPIVPREPGVVAFRRQFRVNVSGPGVRDGGNVSFPNAGVDGKNAFVAMSGDLALRSWAAIREAGEKQGRPVAGSQIDLERIGSDWRALSGVACLWVTAAELDRLRPDQRRAVLDWIALGGRMVWAVHAESKRTPEELGAVAGRIGPHRLGLGEISILKWNGRELDVDEALERIHQPVPILEKMLAQSYHGWDPNGIAKQVRVPVALLATFMTLFAIVVGPVNLFCFAGAGRRHRLFWTTPLISLTAGILLAVTILLQDGLGGDGFRISFSYTDPTRHQLVVLQEQVSRTGLLLNRNFQLEESALVTPIALDASTAARAWVQDGRSLSGAWFLSRAVQGQVLKSVIPARARVELVDRGADGTGPTIVSTLPHVLDRIFYLDDDGDYWAGGPVRAGEHVTLRGATPEEARSFMDDAGADGGPLIVEGWRANFPSRGTFYGVGVVGPFLNTLDSIRWDREVALVRGPVVHTATSIESASEAMVAP